MGAVYGDQLTFFPELMEQHTVFRMDPRKVGGYGKRYDERKIVGYFSYIKGGKLEIEGDLLTENQNATFWVKDKTGGKGIIRQGEFLERNGDIYRFVHDDGFSREGGFIVYNLQLVAGPTDKQYTNEKVNLGVNDYE
jgi:hypothetical protein